MYRLAKIGFSQSYTYFAWRNDPWSIRQYYTELNTPPVSDFFRPNAWPNTPDILPEPLQFGGRGAYVSRAVLASTLCANYGVYGPAFELMEHRALKANSEEYYDSEKYQIRYWNLNQPNTLADFLSRLNQIRRENPALQYDRNLTFHDTDNGAIVCYSKRREDNVILVAVNCDPYHTQWANLNLNLEAMGLTHDRPFQAHDLLTGARYRWQGNHAVVGLDTGTQPAHLFAIRRHARTEFDFEYFL
jgi:starch synthase (maltosyl-transferring)